MPMWLLAGPLYSLGLYTETYRGSGPVLSICNGVYALASCNGPNENSPQLASSAFLLDPSGIAVFRGGVIL